MIHNNLEQKANESILLLFCGGLTSTKQLQLIKTSIPLLPLKKVQCWNWQDEYSQVIFQDSGCRYNLQVYLSFVKKQTPWMLYQWDLLYVLLLMTYLLGGTCQRNKYHHSIHFLFFLSACVTFSQLCLCFKYTRIKKYLL